MRPVSILFESAAFRHGNIDKERLRDKIRTGKGAFAMTGPKSGREFLSRPLICAARMKKPVQRAGAAAFLPKPPKHNLMKLPSFRGAAEVRSSLPGRMRVYVPAVTQNPVLAGQMAEQLESTGVIHRVKAEPRTGSVLICYDESRVRVPVVLGAMMKLMELDGKVKTAPACKVQEGIRLLLAAVNQGILDATDGLLDAKTLTAGAMTFAALRSKTKYGWAAPGAMTLLWRASKLFEAQSNE